MQSAIRTVYAVANFKSANPRTLCQVIHSETWSPTVAHHMLAAGVPCVPGYHGNNQDPDFLLREAEKIGQFHRTRIFQHLLMTAIQVSLC